MENKEKFWARIDPFFAPSVQQKIKLAYLLAKAGHRAQVRKELFNGEPMRYFEHLRRVALVLMDEVGCMVPEMIIAALLHDSLEDTEDLTPELLEMTFGTDIVGMVKWVSKTPKEGYVDRLMLCTDWRPLLLKGCDRLDNLRSLMHPGVTIEFQKRQIAETREKYFPVFERLVTLAPPEYTSRASALRDQILKITERCATMIEMKEAKV